MDLFDIAVASKLAGGGGGGGGLDLLATKSLGTVTTTSGSGTSIGQTVTVENIDAYDLLLFVTAIDTIESNKHVATVDVLALTNTAGSSTKSTASPLGKINYKDYGGYVGSVKSSQGIYSLGASISSGTLSAPMYASYSNSYTGTIDGNYTTKVFGVKLYDIITS